MSYIFQKGKSVSKDVVVLFRAFKLFRASKLSKPFSLKAILSANQIRLLAITVIIITAAVVITVTMRTMRAMRVLLHLTYITLGFICQVMLAFKMTIERPWLNKNCNSKQHNDDLGAVFTI